MRSAGRLALGALVTVLFFSCVTVGTVTPLHEAVRDGDIATAEAEVARGARLDAVDEEGRTPLHYACANGDERMARLLLEAGANPNIQDARGETPLHYAASNCYASIVVMLLDAEADPNLLDGRERTPLDVAREIECLEVISLLEAVSTQ